MWLGNEVTSTLDLIPNLNSSPTIFIGVVISVFVRLFFLFMDLQTHKSTCFVSFINSRC